MRYREPTHAEVKKYAPLDAGTIRNRHNKTARGMSKTAARGRHNSSSMDSCILALMVRGTTDKLRVYRTTQHEGVAIVVGKKIRTSCSLMIADVHDSGGYAMKRFKMVIIDGRRWFQKTYGNTYHAVSVTVDGVTTTSGQHYGYGEQYRQTAFDMLQAQGYFKGYIYSTFCSWCCEEKNRNKIHFTCADVKRERDL